MKKLITLSMILALSAATVVEAKGRSGGFRSSSMMKPVQTQPRNTIKNDATFENTPKPAMAKPQPQAQGSTMGNFVTGAAAGYLLSEALSSNTAVANPAQTQAQPMAQTEQQAQAPAPALPNEQEFKSLGIANDPFLVEKTEGYRRYCLNGVQYIASGQGENAPTPMLAKNGLPAECKILP